MSRREQLHDVAAVFGDAADLKTPFMHGHSGRVGTLTERAGVVLGLDTEAAARLATRRTAARCRAASASPTRSGRSPAR